MNGSGSGMPKDDLFNRKFETVYREFKESYFRERKTHRSHESSSFSFSFGDSAFKFDL